MDISKAFDKVWHDGLIFKLKQNGVSGELLKLLKNYLSNRKQRVVLNGSAADYDDVKSGVPQGSVLGPLLFLIYINDLEQNIKSQVRFFADDTMLFSIVKNPVTSANDLNQDLETIRQWAHQWKMEFNPDPTKQATELLFSCKNDSPIHPPILFNGIPVSKVDEHKHLGVILDSKLSFQSHVNEKITKTKKTIGIIKHLSQFLPIKTLIVMYKSLVRPHLDYCDVIIHSPPPVDMHNPPPPFEDAPLNTLMKKIESVQYQAALAITGTWKGTSRVKIYKELGFESLSKRRSLHRIIQIFKILNNLTPAYLRDKLPARRIRLLRNDNPNVLRERTTRTERHEHSFFPDAISLWNKTVREFQDVTTISKIKSKILKRDRPEPRSFFGIHDPIGLHYLFQLRTGLSPLRSHKHHHNFLDTPSDSCRCQQGIENTNHFIFYCLFFANYRASLAAEIINILSRNNLLRLANELDLYLYGNPLLSLDDNKLILLSTIKYIKKTQRFSKKKRKKF